MVDALYALTGRKSPTRYADIVRATAPTAVDTRIAEQSDSLAQQSLDLSEEELEQAKQEYEQTLQLQREIADQAGRDADLSSGISTVDLGIRAAPHLKKAYGGIKSMIGGGDPYALNIPEPVMASYYGDPIDTLIADNPVSVDLPAVNAPQVPQYSTNITIPQTGDFFSNQSPYTTDPVKAFGEEPASLDLSSPNAPVSPVAGMTNLNVPTPVMESFYGGSPAARFGQQPVSLNTIDSLDLALPSAVPNLATMGAANTAATGGLVGAADVAGLAAAEAGAAGAGAAGAAPMAAIAPYLGPAAVAAMAAMVGGGIYNSITKKKRKGYVPEQILNAYESVERGEQPLDMKLVQGQYLYDPDASKQQGKEIYHDLFNKDYMDTLRGSLKHHQTLTEGLWGDRSHDRERRQILQGTDAYRQLENFDTSGMNVSGIKSGAGNLLNKAKTQAGSPSPFGSKPSLISGMRTGSNKLYTDDKFQGLG